MSVALQTPELLQLLNNFIVMIVTFIELYFPIIFAFCMFFFCVWFFVQLGLLIKELIERIGGP